MLNHWLIYLLSCSDYKLGSTPGESNEPKAGPGSDESFLTGLPPENACDSFDAPNTDIAVTEGCERVPTSGLLDTQLEWTLTGFRNYSEYAEIVMAPVVGQLTDDNNDSLIDWRDYPDIAIIADDAGANESVRGILRIIGGRNGVELREFVGETLDDGTQVYPYRYSNIALADIDQDSQPELVFLSDFLGGASNDTAAPPPEPTSEASDDTSGQEDSGGSNNDNPIRPPPPNPTPIEPPEPVCRLTAINTDMSVEWVSGELDLDCGGHAPAIADLEGDGTVEIVIGSNIIQGATGEVRSSGSMDKGRYDAYTELGSNTIISDINMDGLQEVIAGRTVYSAFGTEICSGSSGDDGFSAAADLDGDGFGEFIVVGNSLATIFDTDCSLIRQWPLVGGGTGGPPTIADYDGDMEPEIGLVDASFYTVYDTNGVVLWSAPVTDMSSHATGSVVFDFEGDGFPEVVYGDELALWIFDGRDGSVRLRDDGHNSRTLHEYPTIADIDNDGSAEIIVVNGGSHYGNNSTGIYALGSTTDNWQRSRQVWNQHAYNIVNINEDLSVPETPLSNWPTYNNFRSGDVNPLAGSSAADAAPAIDLCTAECDYDRLVANIRIANQGLATLRAGIAVSVYAGNPDLSGAFAPAPLHTEIINELIPGGSYSSSFQVDLVLSTLPDKNFTVIVDSNNAVAECTETNNRFTVENIECPN